MELIQIEDRRAVVRNVSDAEVIPSYSQACSESRSHFPFVLEVGHVESAAILVAAPRCNKRNVSERCRNQAGVIAKVQSVVRRLTLVETNAANLHTGLKRVTASSPSKIVNESESRSDLDVGCIVVD